MDHRLLGFNMDYRILDFNEANSNRNFSLSILEEEDWCDFVTAVLYEKSNNFPNLKSKKFEVILRDNKAFVKICYEDNFYCESKFVLDEFGIKKENHEDIISQIWQEIMMSYYGKTYAEALDGLASVKQTM